MTAPVKLWRYYLPSVNGEGWAVIVLGSDGFFGAVSDYGNYTHLWIHHDKSDFREFFLNTASEWDYFAGKIAGREAGKEYDRKTRKRQWKASVEAFCKQTLSRLADAIRAELAAEAA